MNLKKLLILLVIIIFIAASVSSVVSKIKLKSELEPQPTTQTQYTASQIQSITISAAGDCTFATDEYAGQIKSFVETADENGYGFFMQNVRSVFENDDLSIVNFEGTLSDRGEREDKQFAFRGEPGYAQILTLGNIEAACLSNNHSSDYGSISNTDTFDYLTAEGIVAFDSTRTQVVDVKGIKVGLLGINQLNDIDRTRLETAVNSVKASAPDIIIAFIHWGIEKETEPNEEQIEYGHRAIDLGVDLVIGTHPHVLQGIEAYNGGYIAYSLGNFCFGGNDSPDDMDTIIYQQTFNFENGQLTSDAPIMIVPCTISSQYENGINNYQPTIAVGEKRQQIIEKLNAYNSNLGTLQVSYK